MDLLILLAIWWAGALVITLIEIRWAATYERMDREERELLDRIRRRSG